MLQLFVSGIIWHYTKAYKEIFILVKNIIWFLFHLFSIKDLSTTLFSPWQQLGERYRGRFDIAAWFSATMINILMRLVGFLVKSVTILMGCGLILITLLLSLVVFVLWTLIPVILIFLFISSIKLFLQTK